MKTFRSLSAFALAILVLTSSSSFSVGLHLCQGHVKSVALMGKAAPCEKEKSIPPCHRNQANSCCDDEAVTHEGDSFFGQVSKIELPAFSIDVLPEQTVMIATVSASAFRNRAFAHHTKWRPDDLIIRHRVFLI